MFRTQTNRRVVSDQYTLRGLSVTLCGLLSSKCDNQMVFQKKVGSEESDLLALILAIPYCSPGGPLFYYEAAKSKIVRYDHVSLPTMDSMTTQNCLYGHMLAQSCQEIFNPSTRVYKL